MAYKDYELGLLMLDDVVAHLHKSREALVTENLAASNQLHFATLRVYDIMGLLEGWKKDQLREDIAIAKAFGKEQRVRRRRQPHHGQAEG